MVYRRSMSPALAAILLTALPAEGPIGEEPAPVPAQAAAESAAAPAPAPPPAGEAAKPATEPQAGTPAQAPQPLPEATSPQAAAKPALPRQQLKILAQDSRLEAYGEFRELYEAARYDEALPYAKRVVELSEAMPERDHELPIAYNNLGATQYQLGDYAGAEASYSKSLALLEETQGISSRRLIVPLAGLGAVHAARDEHEIAAELFDRALAVSRRADGLFNLAQLPLIRQAADSRYAFSDYGGAEREHMYALKVAEQNFGYGDARTLEPLLQFGAFYESLREFIAARMMYLRARDVALGANKGYTPEAVKSLCGIARTHRLQYTMDPETLDSQQPARDEVTGEMVGKVYRESRVPPPSADRNGLKAAQQALDMLRATNDPPADLLAETLIELGDWYQSTSRPAISIPYYAEAAGIFDARSASDPAAANPLKAPRLVFYRPPVSASRGLNTLSGQYQILKTVFSFDVSETGEPSNITVVSTNMNEDQVALSRRALQKAIYSPRFANSKAVSTSGVTFTGEWYQEIDPKKVEQQAREREAAEKAATRSGGG
jgi:tetratricopeptide (TPR) repeat protein